jgi:diaminopimelate epimerase
MHGAGNDYIYVNAMQYPISDPVHASILWSDRHKGIGSDGLVLIGASPFPEADFSMRIFNADGSEAMMCGNASRCIGKYLYERGLTTQTQIKLLSNSGIKTLNLHVRNGVVESVTVDMGEPQLENEEQFIPSRGIDQGTFVSMGNPHYVIFTDNVDQVGETGRILEYHPAFPQRCNIEFATPLSYPEGDTMAPSNRTIEAPSGAVEGVLRTRVWERGSGITQACGTGACATAVAACLTGRAGRQSQIVMDGGTLDIEWRESDNHVYMTGPAEFVFDGEIETGFALNKKE